MKKLAIIATCLLSFGAHAGEEDWILIAETDSVVWSAKKGSARLLGKKGNLLGLVERVTVEGRSTYRIASVSADDCKAGMGAVRRFEVTGEYIGKSSYVIDGQTTGDYIASFYCAVAFKMLERANATDAEVEL